MRDQQRECRLTALIQLAQRTKVLRDLRADFPCGMKVAIHANGEVTSLGRRPNGSLQLEVARLLGLGIGEVSATHSVTGRIMQLGKSALER